MNSAQRVTKSTQLRRRHPRRERGAAPATIAAAIAASSAAHRAAARPRHRRTRRAAPRSRACLAPLDPHAVDLAPREVRRGARVSSPHRMPTPYTLVSPSRRDARFTASPSTVYALRKRDPMSPMFITPVLRPIPDVERGPAARAKRSRRASRSASRIVSAAAPRRGVPCVRERRAPERHDRVADVLVDRAAVVVDDRRHRRQVVVHDRRCSSREAGARRSP